MDPFNELPYISKHLSGIGGKIKESVNDFKVDEIAIFEAEGLGQHMFINLTRHEQFLEEILIILEQGFEMLKISGYPINLTLK